MSMNLKKLYRVCVVLLLGFAGADGPVCGGSESTISSLAGAVPPEGSGPEPAAATSESKLYFPDYVDGEGWSVQLVVGNLDAAQSAGVVVDVYDQQGRSVRGFFDSGSRFRIPALGSQVLRSAGTGAFRRGWIEVTADRASVSGLLTYRNADTGVEVGVAPVDLRDHFALFVEESSGIGTGVALFKPEASPKIEIRIRNEAGRDPIGDLLTHGGFRQRAWTLPQWLNGVDQGFLRDFRGLLFLRAEDGSPFGPLGLRFGKRQDSLSAVPVIHADPVLDAGGDAPDALIFPDYVAGGGWSVQLVLGNLAPSRSVDVEVEVYDQDGRAVPGFWGSRSPFEIPALGSRVLSSTGGRNFIAAGSGSGLRSLRFGDC